jgi:hypothetical protein
MPGTDIRLTDADDADAITTLRCQQASHPRPDLVRSTRPDTSRLTSLTHYRWFVDYGGR